MLLALPVELFEQIQEELLVGSRLITKEDVMYLTPLVDKKDFQHRADILWPLAQTCRALRNIYLARVYEHMEAWINRGGYQQGYNHIGKRLGWMCKLLTQERELAKLVR